MLPTAQIILVLPTDTSSYLHIGLLGSYCCQVPEDLTQTFAYMNSYTDVCVRVHTHVFRSCKVASGKTNNMSLYQQSNEILLAHQRWVVDNYTWRGDTETF